MHSGTLHRFIGQFSLYNVVQDYTRYRRSDTLWGLLTPRDSSDVTVGSINAQEPGIQKQPLCMAAKSIADVTARVNQVNADNANEVLIDDVDGSGWTAPFSSDYPPYWSLGLNNQVFGGSWAGYLHSLDFYKTDGVSRPAIQKGARANQDHAGVNILYYRPGVLTLMHDYVYVPTQSRPNMVAIGRLSTGRGANIFSSQRYNLGNIQNSGLAEPGGTKKAEKYTLNQNENLLSATAKPDARGDYLVNYNRVPSFPMRENGSSLYAAAGTVTMDDISTFFRSAIYSLLDEPSSASSLESSLDGAAKKVFENINGTITSSNSGAALNYRVLYN